MQAIFSHLLPRVLLDTFPQHCLIVVHTVTHFVGPSVGCYKSLNAVKEQLQRERNMAMIVTHQMTCSSTPHTHCTSAVQLLPHERRNQDTHQLYNTSTLWFHTPHITQKIREAISLTQTGFPVGCNGIVEAAITYRHSKHHVI